MAEKSGSFDIRAVARQSGATVTREVPTIGIYTVEGDAKVERRLEALRGFQKAVIGKTASVVHPASVAAQPTEGIVTEEAESQADHHHPEVLLPADDDFYFGAQWSLNAIHAPEAWATGQRGHGVRVAVLDTGIDPTHPDLAANVNVALARSFVYGQTWDVSTDAVQEADHGTHISGIIAAADNGFGIIGVAPEAEIVPVQVLKRPLGNGMPDALIEGLVYAAGIGADVINMSIEYHYNRWGGINDIGTPDDPSDDYAYTAQDVAVLGKAFSRATRYAHARGCTMVASGGNTATDADSDRDQVVLPRDAAHVLGIAGTGPLGWAMDFETDLDVPGHYTDHGKRAIDFSAPGGNLDFDLFASGEFCTVSSSAISATYPCWLFDGVLGCAPVKGYFYQFRKGTSMAAAHVSGVAALIIGKNGGSMSPLQVTARLRMSADDLGEKNRDGYHGWGRVNAYRAVQ
jgi:subtilisin family serine protease